MYVFVYQLFISLVEFQVCWFTLFDSRFTEAKLEKYYCLLTWCEFILSGKKKKIQ